MNAVDLQREYQNAIENRVTAGRQACPTVEAIVALAAGEGHESARLATLDHVMACPPCQREFELLRAIHAAGRSRSWFAQPRRYVIAAAAMLVAGATIYYAATRSAPLMRGPAVAADGPVPVSPRDDVAAAAARTFIWRPLPNAVRYRIVLVEADGRLRAAGSVSDTTWQLSSDVELRTNELLEWLVEAELADGRVVRSATVRLRLR